MSLDVPSAAIGRILPPAPDPDHIRLRWTLKEMEMRTHDG